MIYLKFSPLSTCHIFRSHTSPQQVNFSSDENEFPFFFSSEQQNLTSSLDEGSSFSTYQQCIIQNDLPVLDQNSSQMNLSSQ
jgi:hypothetical protein